MKDKTSQETSKYDVIIIGSGFGGLCQAILLKQKGIHNFLILEKESDLGGTWRDNTYPGCACDVPSALYTFSFEALEGAYQTYLGQPAILDYIRELACKYKLTPHIRYNQNVCGLVYEEAFGRWKISTCTGKNYTAQFVVSAVGQLHHPHIPQFPDAGLFQGEIIHTAQFGSRKLEQFFNQKVAVIGSGASAIQLVPELQTVCQEVHLYQRTPSYIMPKLELSPAQERFVTKYSFLRRHYRSLLQELGDGLLLGAIKGSYLESKIAMWLFQCNLSWNLRDARLQKAFIPPYPIGARRTLVSNDFFPAISQHNVQVHLGKIQGLQENGIVNSDGSITKVNAIFFATGFETNPFLKGIDVVGRNGKQLWADEKGRFAHAYLGVATRGFPNLFFLNGPNTTTGSTSALLYLEEECQFITCAIQHVRKSHIYRSIEVKASVEEAFNQEIQQAAQNIAFTKIDSSWYLYNGRLVNNWIGSFREFQDRIRAIDLTREFEYLPSGNSNNNDTSPLVRSGSESNDTKTNDASVSVIGRVVLDTFIKIPIHACFLLLMIVRVSIINFLPALGRMMIDT